MDSNVGLLLFAILCASVSGVQGVCRQVKNDDMIEYFCQGGQLLDLDDLPASTGKIRIANMPIPRITVDTFSKFGSDLWVLGCSHCGIMDIEPGAFERLDNLQQLSLDNNHLGTVKESWFKGLDYLTYLDLNYNNIQSIEDGVFKSLPSLVDLRLSGNRLECLNLAAMSHLKDLKRMFIAENAEFKCPNAVSAFLDSRGVSFEKDPEWRRLPSDLVPAEIPIDYATDEDETTTEVPTTPLPAYRERLHPTTITPPAMVESTVPYIPSRFYTTEEVVYRPIYNTPDWRTTPRPITVHYEEPTEPATPPSYEYPTKPATPPSYEYPTEPATPPSYGYPTRTYTPPKAVEPIDFTTYPSRDTTTQHTGQDLTTLRTWPRFPESTTTRPDVIFYPPHENWDNQYTEEPDYSTSSFSLAPGPGDSHQTPSYGDSEIKHYSNIVEVDWRDRSTAPSNIQYPPHTDTSPPEYRVPSMEPPQPTHVVRPVPYAPPEMIQPISPDNVYQAPYYEHAVTVHSPPFVVNQPQQEEVTPGILPIETTTDKPLPNCPTKNLSSSSKSSIAMITVSVFLVIAGRVLVEGF